MPKPKLSASTEELSISAKKFLAWLKQRLTIIQKILDKHRGKP